MEKETLCAEELPRGPVRVEVEAGKTYFWCSCKLSKTLPFCDGAHKGSGMKSVRFECATSGVVYFCGCYKTSGAPICDGSHKRESESI